MKRLILDGLALAAIMALPFVPQAIAARSDIAAAPVFQIEAIDSHGEFWIAGVGDNCAAAWQGAELPPETEYVECVER